MSYVQQSYSDAVRQAVWKNTLSEEQSIDPSVSEYTVRTDRQLAWLAAGTLGTLLCVPGITSAEHGVLQGQYSLDWWGSAPSNVPTPRHAETLKPVSINEMVELAKETFGLSAVQIAGMLNISRPSLYNHISGKEVPKDLSAYEMLFHTAQQVKSSVGRSLKPGLKNILIDGKTLLGHLNDAYWDSHRMDHYSRMVAEKLNELNDPSGSISLSDQKKAMYSISKSG